MFNKKLHKLTFNEQVIVEDYLRHWNNECDGQNKRRFNIMYFYDSHNLYIITDNPGYMIGYGGSLINKYSKNIKREVPKIKNIILKESKLL